MFATRVVGYQGCEKVLGEAAIAAKAPLKPSNSKHDWLGRGTYFWESDPQRAREWANYKLEEGMCKEPFVVGAIIELGHCFDLTVRSNLDLLGQVYEDFKQARTAAGLEMPKNHDSKKVKSTNKVIRTLDCAMLNYFCDAAEEGGFPSFDTIRGVFVEGTPAFPGSEIYHKTHVQIAVRNQACIKAFFLP